MALSKLKRRQRIKRRIRKVVLGSSSTPRLSIYRSNKQVYAQLIDDSTGYTLVSSSSKKNIIVVKEATKMEQAKLVGKHLAEKALLLGINKVRFDRNGYLYHGRVKSLADGAREGGLNF